MKKKEIREKYYDYVVENKKPPKSLGRFIKSSVISKDDFLKKYDDLSEVEADIWKHSLKDVLETLRDSAEFAAYSNKDRGLAMVYSWFEFMELNEKFFKNCNIINLGPCASQKHLEKFKKTAKKFVKNLVKGGKNTSEFKDRGIPDKFMVNSFWSLFSMNLSSWKKCSKSKKKQEDWETVITNERNPKSLDNDGYFRLFYAENPCPKYLARGVYDEFFAVVNGVTE